MMKRTTEFFAIAVLAAVMITGCDGSSSSANATGSQNAPDSMPGMSAMQPAARSAEHMTEGTVNSVDQAAGRVNISHGPVASAKWPGMTMSFKLADPSAAADLKSGQRVEFHFTITSGMDATVTQIKAVN